MLPDQIDIWTGNPVNDIDNPYLRALNALSPVKVSGTNEPWRVSYVTYRYDGLIYAFKWTLLDLTNGNQKTEK